jgi:RNA polymerase sigma-70 factor (ECF subfamily)
MVSAEPSETASFFEEKLAEARRTWEGVDVPRERFVAYVDARVSDDAPLTELVLVDLYLACACAGGDSAAIRAFEKAFGADAEAAFARHHGRGVSSRDLRQLLRDRLFAPPEPKITAYAGRGSLRSWLRITLVRMRIDAERRRAARPEEPQLDAGVMAPDSALDPELLHMKRHYREAFVAALEAALASLAPRDRNLLRLKLRDDLGTGQIAAAYGVHRATAKRWLADVRQRLLTATRAEMRTRLDANTAEVESALRMLDSQLDVSVGRMLGDEPEPSGPGAPGQDDGRRK